jgi:glutamate N-acetyltransferase/amino-acid N-acetyltransferase
MANLHLLSPLGFRAAGVAAAIKTTGKADVGILACAQPAAAAAVFTTNKVFAAPIAVGREHIAGGKLRAIVVNAGNANACTGAQGLRDANKMCALTGKLLGCEPGLVLPSSTGIIGHLMPMEKVERGIAAASAALGNSAEHALNFAEAILTTDLKRKSAAVEFKLGKRTVRLAGVCKGSGMIGPHMSIAGPPAPPAPHATMLAYLTTDAAVPAGLLRKLLAAATDQSFNAVTVDDHTSTNDTAVLLASGASQARVNSPRAAAAFSAALSEVCQSLAYQIAADGEGATKVVAIHVRSAASLKAAQAIARAIANSPLVKCAMHGNDPNWGRIVSAAGLAGVPFDPDRAALTLQGTVVFRNGRPLPFDAAKLSELLKSPDVKVELTCRLGSAEATCWACDLSREYITINADYHT